MNKKLLFLMAGIVSITGQAQVQIDTVELGAGYAQQGFYELESGNEHLIDKSDYELSFQVDNGYATSIHFNASSGAKVWTYPNGTVQTWNDVDTAGISHWSHLYDDPSDWSLGAFDHADPNNAYDVGWGIYNVTTHVITGDSIYVVELADGTYKKLQIIDYASGAFNFQYANLDGSDLIQSSIVKSDYVGKHFAYYSLSTNEALDLEPSTGWDLIFGQYTEFLPSPYLVSGILSAPGAQVAEVEGVDPSTYEDYQNSTFGAEKNAIGYDWKSFTGMGYEIQDDLVYFVETNNGDIWKIVPLGFGGSANGQFIFSKEKLATATLADSQLNEILVYPNPATTHVHLNRSTEQEIEVVLRDVYGRVVLKQFVSGYTSSIAIDGIGTGNYWLMAGSTVQQIQIK